MTSTVVDLHTKGTPPALEVSGVASGYEMSTVLHGVSITIPAGASVAVLGPNGAGKTTLLKTISGLVEATDGSVSMDGEDIGSLAPVDRARRGLCLIPEGHAVFRRLTVKENLILQCVDADVDSAIARAVEAFPILGTRLTQVAGTMSGGEQQMLALARAYVTEPRVVMVDEASLGLAPQIVELVFAVLGTLVERGASLLVVDQFISRALAMSSYAYVMSHGSVVAEGTPAELGSEDVFQSYFGG